MALNQLGLGFVFTAKDEATEVIERIKESFGELEHKIKSYRMKKGTIQAKVNLAKNQDLSTSSLDEFERMSDKVDDGENRLEAERGTMSTVRTL